MEALISAVTGDLVSRFISFLTAKYRKQQQKSEEEELGRLKRLLLRAHTVVEEAELRQLMNHGMLLQLKMLAQAMYGGHYILDAYRYQDEVSQSSLALPSSNPPKRLCLAGSFTKDRLQSVLGSLEAAIDDLREFVILLGTCPRLVRQPYSTYLFMDKCVFGRHAEREQIISFLLQTDHHLGVLPIVGAPRVGKKTLVQHVCSDERVRSCFPLIVFFDGDDLGTLENKISLCQKYLLVIALTSCVDVASWPWERFYSFMDTTGMARRGSKIIVMSRSDEVMKWGTTRPIRLKALSQEEYWYFFKVLAFGSMDPEENPKLASLGMQIAAVLKGKFIVANIMAELMRANPNATFWARLLASLRETIQEHFSAFSEHPEDLLEKNHHINLGNVALGAPGCLLYDVREVGSEQSELPRLTARELLLGSITVPSEEKFDVLLWKSCIPPYGSYIATFVKEKPQLVVKKRKKKNLLQG